MISNFLNKIPHFKITSYNNARRQISNTPTLLDNGDQSKPSSAAMHKVNNFERRVLVWTGKYKSIEEVPAYVAPAVMERARSRMRIRISNRMMIATLLGCVAMIWLGKRQHKSGDSLEKRNLDMHKQYNEKYADKTEK